MALKQFSDNISVAAPKAEIDSWGVLDSTSGKWRPYISLAEVKAKDSFPADGKIYPIRLNGQGKPEFYIINGDPKSVPDWTTLLVKLFDGGSVTTLSYTPEAFGAKGDGTTDDSAAFQDMFNAIAASSKVSFHVKLDAKVYRLVTPVTFTLTTGYTQKFVQIEGHGTRILDHGGGITFLVPDNTGVGQQDCHITVDNIDFYGQDSTRDPLRFTLAFNRVDFALVRNCKFFNCGCGPYMTFAGMGIVDSCFSWSCDMGFRTYQMRDTKFVNCHAYGSRDTGFLLKGQQEGDYFGSSGGVNLINCTANASTKTNMVIDRIYQTVMNHITLEQSPRNLTVLGSQYGSMTNCWIGPSSTNAAGDYSVYFEAKGYSNDVWTITGGQWQDRVYLKNCNRWHIVGVDFPCGKPNNSKDNASLTFDSCASIDIDSSYFKSASSYTIKVLANTAEVRMNNIHTDGQVKIDGEPDGRFGGHTIMGPSILGGGLDSFGRKANEFYEYVNNYVNSANLFTPYEQTYVDYPQSKGQKGATAVTDTKLAFGSQYRQFFRWPAGSTVTGDDYNLYGGYQYTKAGRYTASLKLRVDDNTSTDDIILLEFTSQQYGTDANGNPYVKYDAPIDVTATMRIKPSDFKDPNKWQWFHITGDSRRDTRTEVRFKFLKATPCVIDWEWTRIAFAAPETTSVVVKEWFGTQAQYDAIVTKDPQTKYYIQA